MIDGNTLSMDGWTESAKGMQLVVKKTAHNGCRVVMDVVLDQMIQDSDGCSDCVRQVSANHSPTVLTINDHSLECHPVPAFKQTMADNLEYIRPIFKQTVQQYNKSGLTVVAQSSTKTGQSLGGELVAKNYLRSGRGVHRTE